MNSSSSDVSNENFDNARNQVYLLFLGLFEKGKTGNEILSETLRIGKEKGYKPQIYTHPLGTYGHSACITFNY